MEAIISIDEQIKAAEEHLAKLKKKKARVTPALKRCPFCGSQAKVEDDCGLFYVSCTHCSCTLGLQQEHDRHEVWTTGTWEEEFDAVEAWNFRANRE
jgi:hypothetical protein